jgi:hypothetical protein
MYPKESLRIITFQNALVTVEYKVPSRTIEEGQHTRNSTFDTVNKNPNPGVFLSEGTLG